MRQRRAAAAAARAPLPCLVGALCVLRAVYSEACTAPCCSAFCTCRESDLEVNPVKAKKLTNVRNTGSEERVSLAPPRLMTLEDAIG